MNELPVIVFDFETTGVDINKLHPIQVAALALDPRKLEPIAGGTFESMMCPEGIEDWAAAEREWAGALQVNKKTITEIQKAPKEGEVWKAFVAFVNKFNPKGNHYNAPIAAGQNIDRFDLPIADRLNRKHKISVKEGKPLLFNQLITVDLKNVFWMWFEGNNELKNYSMNSIRPYFGIEAEGAHDALVDVRQCADLIVKFLRLHRRVFPQIPFKGSFSREKGDE